MMNRKVLLDMDPGFDDALALALALAAPEVDVMAVTATGGNIAPQQASRNVQALVEFLDPPLRPRMGRASDEQILRSDSRHLHGPDGLLGANLDVAELVNQHTSLKVMAEEIRRAPHELTIVATGPLTNLANLIRSDPDIATLIGHLVIAGGTVSAPGNATAAAEFNVYCDSEAAKVVFQSPVTKTLVPLDASGQLTLGFEFLERVKKADSRTTELLEKILPGAYRNYRQWLGVEGIQVQAAVALIAVLRPSLFSMQTMFADVETVGELTHGATVFDRRANSPERPNMDVAVEMEAEAVEAALVMLLEGAN